MPSTHDQMIKCDWTCGALRIRAEASPSKPSSPTQRAPLKRGRAPNRSEAGGGPVRGPRALSPARISASHARSSSSTIDSTASKGARSWPSR